jgi:hypothetical protein
MEQIDLTKAELFKDLIEITANDQTIDLHNEYDCIEIDYSAGSMKFVFKNLLTDKRVVLSFDNVIISEFKFLQPTVNMKLILDLFYRGRFEEGGTLSDQKDERYFCYVEI